MCFGFNTQMLQCPHGHLAQVGFRNRTRDLWCWEMKNQTIFTIVTAVAVRWLTLSLSLHLQILNPLDISLSVPPMQCPKHRRCFQPLRVSGKCEGAKPSTTRVTTTTTTVIAGSWASVVAAGAATTRTATAAMVTRTTTTTYIYDAAASTSSKDDKPWGRSRNTEAKNNTLTYDCIHVPRDPNTP